MPISAVTPLVETLLKKMQGQPRYASIEQAAIITRSYLESEGQPHIIRRALSLKAALEEIEIAVEPEERIVGNRTAGVRRGVVFPESGSNWVNREFENLPVRDQDRFNVRESDIEQFRREIVPYWKGTSLEDVLRTSYGQEFDDLGMVVKINQKDHAQGHICPDCERWLKLGPSGLKRWAEDKLSGAQGEKALFYRAVVIVMEGAAAFMRRYAGLAASMGMDEVAQNCANLAVRPAKTFREALQSIWFLFVILQMESNASSFSPGRMDRFPWPYYERDGLDDGEALELIECLWLKFNQIAYMRNAHSAKYFAGFPIGFNIAVGGVDEDGNDFCNALSFLLLRAQKDLGLSQPNLSVRLHAGTGDELLKESVRVVAKGSGMPQYFGDSAVIPALQALGVSEADARNYAIVGCVELTTQGNNLGWSDAAMFNMNKVLELALNGGKCLLTGRQLAPDYGDLIRFETFDALEEALRRHLDDYMDRMVAACEVVEKAHKELLPSPFLSAVIRDCMEDGVDVTAGGAFIYQGRIINGAHDNCAEIWNMIVNEDGYYHKNANPGCLNEQVSGSGFARIASERFGRNMSGRELFELHRQGNPAAAEIVEKAADNPAKGIANITCTLDPEAIVIGGSVAIHNWFFIERAAHLAKKYVNYPGEVDVRAAKFGDDAGLIGAALLVCNDIDRICA